MTIWTEAEKREILGSLDTLHARLESLESDVRAIMNHLHLGDLNLKP